MGGSLLLTASRRGQDKRGRQRGAAIPHGQRSQESVAKYGKLRQTRVSLSMWQHGWGLRNQPSDRPKAGAAKQTFEANRGDWFEHNTFPVNSQSAVSDVHKQGHRTTGRGLLS